MKKSSIKKLIEARNLADGYDEGCISLKIDEVLRAEFMAQEARERKFNLLDWVSNDWVRPVINGVYHDGGMKIATDAHILVAIHEEYPDELEGKIIDKEGSCIEGKYPNWKSVIPNPSEEHEIVRISPYSFMHALTAARSKTFVTEGVSMRWHDLWAVKVGQRTVSAKKFDMMLSFMKRYGVDSLEVYGPGKGLVARTVDSIALIAPLLDDAIDLNILTTY